MVLCYPRAIDIDEDGRFLKNNSYKLDTGSIYPHRRLRDLICINHSCLAIFALIRASVLKETQLIGSYVASDRLLLAEIGLRGRFYEVQEDLFLHREHSFRSTRHLPTLHSRQAWFDPTKQVQIIYPTWRLLMEYPIAISRASLGRRERLYCYLQMAPWLWGNWKGMMADLAIGAKQILTIGRSILTRCISWRSGSNEQQQ